MKKLRIILFFSLSTINLFAQKAETLDSLFNIFITSEFFVQATDSLPELFYHDSILFKYSDLILVKSITQEERVPVSITREGIKLFNWNNIPKRASNDLIRIKSEKKLFKGYEVGISVPLINPNGHKRKKGECCEDTHYIIGGKFLVKEKNDQTEISLVNGYFFLNTICITFL